MDEEKEMKKRLGVFLLLAVPLVLLVLPSDVKAYNPCKTCSVDLCIPVWDEFGYSFCDEGELICTPYSLPDGGVYFFCYRQCTTRNPCLLAPP